MQAQINRYIASITEELAALTLDLYNHPELGHEEVYASAAHVAILSKYGFTVEAPYCGMATAYKATYSSAKPGPTIAYISEYDALPGIGHGCGHNILGATSIGAGITLKNIIDDLGGTVIVFGPPAEETDGGKVAIANSGAFDNVDIAMMSHPSEHYSKSSTTAALMPMRFEFFGKTAHAAGCPEEGINALHACISLFNNISSLREHIRSDSRVHGIIRNGGEAANIVPEYASADFYVRSATMTYQKELIQKVRNCAEAAALSNGATVKISQFEADYANMVTNQRLSALVSEKLVLAGVDNEQEGTPSCGSTDAGNVSQRCPMVHTHFAIKETGHVTSHSREFAECTITDYATAQMAKTIEAFVLTAVEVIQNPAVLQEIKDEFANTEM